MKQSSILTLYTFVVILKTQKTVTGTQHIAKLEGAPKTECLTGNAKKHPRQEFESISCKNGLRAVYTWPLHGPSYVTIQRLREPTKISYGEIFCYKESLEPYLIFVKNIRFVLCIFFIQYVLLLNKHVFIDRSTQNKKKY